MSNNAKNIYYTSNSFQSKYPTNCRSSFSSQIDEQEFHYIDKRNVKIGLKQITFENTYTTFKTKYGSPRYFSYEKATRNLSTYSSDI